MKSSVDDDGFSLHDQLDVLPVVEGGDFVDVDLMVRQSDGGVELDEFLVDIVDFKDGIFIEIVLQFLLLLRHFGDQFLLLGVAFKRADVEGDVDVVVLD